MREGLDSTGEGEPDPVREIEREGETWVIRAAGSTSSGRSADPSAPLLHLTFSSGADGGAPKREVLVIGRSLDALSDESLNEALDRSRASAEPKPRAERASGRGARDRGQGRTPKKRR